MSNTNDRETRSYMKEQRYVPFLHIDTTAGLQSKTTYASSYTPLKRVIFLLVFDHAVPLLHFPMGACTFGTHFPCFVVGKRALSSRGRRIQTNSVMIWLFSTSVPLAKSESRNKNRTHIHSKLWKSTQTGFNSTFLLETHSLRLPLSFRQGKRLFGLRSSRPTPAMQRVFLSDDVFHDEAIFHLDIDHAFFFASPRIVP